jgi:hypothetical protein
MNMSARVFWLILTVLGVAPFAAKSQLYWQFDTTEFVVQPTDSILITATITNSSNTPYLIQNYGAAFGGSLQSQYQISFLLNLAFKTVPAYGTLDFNFCELTPIGGQAAAGVYYSAPPPDEPILNVGLGSMPSQNSVQITVVPEPATVFLAGVGLAFLSIFRLRILAR